MGWMQALMWRAIMPAMILAGGGGAADFLVLAVVSALEHRAHRPGVFDLVITRLDAPLWLVLIALNLIVNGFVLARWAVFFAVDLARLGNGGYELALPVPLGKVAAANIALCGVSVLVFLVARPTICHMP